MVTRLESLQRAFCGNQKGSRGTVVKNEWPTGFMKDYLEMSPTALEIFQSMK